MREWFRIPVPIRTLWRRKLRPLLDAWGYFDDLGGFVRFLWWIALFFFPSGAALSIVGVGVAAALGWLSGLWFLVVVGAALVVSLGPWAVLWWKQHSRGAQRRYLAVEHAGVRWVRITSYYGSGHSVAEAQCPQHKVRLFYRPISVHEVIMNRLWEPESQDLVGPAAGTLWCVQGEGHDVAVETGASLMVPFGQVKEAAEALLDAKLAELKGT
jgi:hypothetical protein